MNEIMRLGLALVAGGLLGALFFGGLWWTVQKLASSTQPALLVFVSLMLRTGIALAGFYAIARGGWEQLLVSLLGFVIARVIVVRLTRASDAPANPAHEASHAA